MLKQLLLFMEVNNNSALFGLIILLLLFAVIGAVFLILGINVKNSKTKKKKTYSLIGGSVSDYTIHSDHDSCDTYGLVVTYVINGITYKCKSHYSTSAMRKEYPLGTIVSVRYNPKNPTDSFLDVDKSHSMLIGGGFSYILFGLVAILIILFVLFLA